VSRTYSGWHARHYDAIWRAFEQRTLAAALSLVDFDALTAAHDGHKGPPRLLDAACGTGRLLCCLLEHVPDAEAVGVDAGADMLVQARQTLRERPRVRLIHAAVGTGSRAGLPLAVHSFDLVTCTNALNYFPQPVASLAGLAELLAPGGQLVLGDYARHGPPFPWPLFEWVVRRVDAGHVRAYTLEEACRVCAAAGLRVEQDAVLAVDWLWHAWALRAQATVPA